MEGKEAIVNIIMKKEEVQQKRKMLILLTYFSKVKDNYCFFSQEKKMKQKLRERRCNCRK